MSQPCEYRNADEPDPEMVARLKATAFACHNLTLREAALLARERTAALHQVQQAEPKLAQLGERLTLAALAVTEPLPLADPAPAPVRAGDRLGLAVIIPRARFGVTIVVATCVAIGLTAYSCLPGQSADLSNLPLPAELLALVFLLVVLPAQACAMHFEEQNRSRTARAAARRDHHRAWLALDAEVNRLLVAYHRGIADAEARILHQRARHGQADPFPAPRAETVAAPPFSVRAVEPTSWLGVPTPPGVQRVLEPSLRLLERYRPDSFCDGS